MSRDPLPVADMEHYLGDGLYASFDGYAVVLRAPRANGDHLVVLELEVYKRLREWIAGHPRLAEHMGEGARDDAPA